MADHSPSTPTRIIVLISGSGTNLQALIDASSTTSSTTPALPNTQITRVISDRKNAYGLTRAHTANIPTTYHAWLPFKNSYPDDPSNPQASEARNRYDAALADLILQQQQQQQQEEEKEEEEEEEKEEEEEEKEEEEEEKEGEEEEKEEEEEEKEEEEEEEKEEEEEEEKEEEEEEKISKSESQKPHLIVCAGWMRILTPSFLTPMREAGIPIINLHPALPGDLVGAGCIERAWKEFEENKRTKTGIMIHYVIPEVDLGEPIVSEEVGIAGCQTLAELQERIHEAEHGLIVEGTRRVVELVRGRQ